MPFPPSFSSAPAGYSTGGVVTRRDRVESIAGRRSERALLLIALDAGRRRAGQQASLRPDSEGVLCGRASEESRRILCGSAAGSQPGEVLLRDQRYVVLSFLSQFLFYPSS